MADDHYRKLMEGFRLIHNRDSNEWEVRWEEPIIVWIDGELTWELPSKLVGISQRFKNGLRAVVVCYGKSEDDPFVAKQKLDCWRYCVNHRYRIVHTGIEIVPPRPPGGVTDETPSQALLASFGRMKATVEALNRRKTPNPFEMIDKREADVIVIYSPKQLVRRKEALADLLWAMPPIVFTGAWEDTEEEGQASSDDTKPSGDEGM